MAEAIAASTQAPYLYEPDSPDTNQAALPAVLTHGLYPFLDADDPAPAYRELWDPLLAAKEPGVIKTVFACLSVNWLATRYEPTVVLVQRNPLNIIASWLSLGYAPDLTVRYGFTPRLVEGILRPLGLPNPPATSVVARTAWWVALLYAALDRSQAAHPEFLAVDHDAACLDPLGNFNQLLSRAGIERSPHLEQYLANHDRPGVGHETSRITSVQPDNWRKKLSQSQVDEAAQVLEHFPHSWWTRHLDDVETQPVRRAAQVQRPMSKPLARRFALAAALLFVAVGVGAASFWGSSPTAPGTALAPATVYAADPARDVAVPGVAAAADLSALDLVGAGAYVDANDIVGRIDLADASPTAMATDLSIYNDSPDSPDDSKDVEYVLQFNRAGHAYFLAFEQDTAGNRRSYGGTVESGSPNPGYTVIPTVPVAYEVIGDSVFLRATAAAFGSSQETTLRGLTALSFVRGTDQSPADAVGSVDAGLRSWQWQPLVMGGGCSAGCPVPSREHPGRP